MPIELSNEDRDAIARIAHIVRTECCRGCQGADQAAGFLEGLAGFDEDLGWAVDETQQAAAQPDLAEKMRGARENLAMTPPVTLPDGVVITSDNDRAVAPPAEGPVYSNEEMKERNAYDASRVRGRGITTKVDPPFVGLSVPKAVSLILQKSDDWLSVAEVERQLLAGGWGGEPKDLRTKILAMVRRKPEIFGEIFDGKIGLCGWIAPPKASAPAAVPTAPIPPAAPAEAPPPPPAPPVPPTVPMQVCRIVETMLSQAGRPAAITELVDAIGQGIEADKAEIERWLGELPAQEPTMFLFVQNGIGIGLVGRDQG